MVLNRFIYNGSRYPRGIQIAAGEQKLVLAGSEGTWQFSLVGSSYFAKAMEDKEAVAV